MRYLLDTHTFLWWHGEPEKLSEIVLDELRNPDNILLLSLVSIWEMQIKVKLGKLQFSESLHEVIKQETTVNQIQFLSITLEHILGIDNLPAYHKDPFDRLLVAQGIIEEITIMTDDSQIGRYPVKIIW